MNEDEVPKENFRGLNDIDEYYSYKLSHEYDRKDDEILKHHFQTFKLPKIMEDYKREVGTYFATKEYFKERIRTTFWKASQIYDKF